jgi:hypothetical protein
MTEDEPLPGADDEPGNSSPAGVRSDAPADRDDRFERDGQPAQTDESQPWDDEPWDPEDEDEEGNIAGEFLAEAPVERGDPSLEGALFVILGAVIGVLGIARTFVIPIGFDATLFGGLVGAPLVVGAVGLWYLGLVGPDRFAP